MSRLTEARHTALLAELQELGREDLRDALRAAIAKGDDVVTMSCLRRVYGHLDAHEDLVVSAIMHTQAAMDALRHKCESQQMVADLARDVARDAWGHN